MNLSFIKTIQSGAVFFWLLLLNTQPSVASNAHNSGLFSRWIATPLREVRTEKGTFKGKILERMVYSGDTAFAVGNIVYFQFPKSIASPQAPAEIIEKIGYALGLKKWSKRSESNAVIYETAWPAAQRYLRIYIIETPISWTYSIAMFRTAYFSSVALESEILQRNLARGPKDPKTWLEQWLFSWNSSSWTNTAYADAAACPSCASDDIPCLIAATHCSEKALIQEIGALNVNLKIIGTEAIPDLNKNWSSTNVALSEINKSWIGTNAEVKNISTEIKRTNDALAQFMQPQNAFLWAAASASGAALGTLSVNLAMDALVAGGNAIMEAITHAKEEAQIVDRFRAAREAWEKMTTLSGSIEKTIDQLLGLRALSKTFKMSREELISRLGAKRAESEARLRNVNRLLEEAVDRDNQVCIAEFSTESSQLSSVVEEISKLKQHLEAPQADQTLCLQLRNNFQRLRELEDGLQEARAAIYGGRDVFLRKLNEKYIETEDAFKRGRNPELAKQIRKDIRRSAKNQLKKTLDSLSEIKDRGIERCLKKLIPGNSLVGSINRFIHRGECEKLFLDSAAGKNYQIHQEEAYLAFQQMHTDAEVTYNRATSDVTDGVLAHNLTHAESLRGFYEWFDQIAMEQDCLSRPESCSKIGTETLLSRFEALAKKHAKLDEACADVH